MSCTTISLNTKAVNLLQQNRNDEAFERISRGLVSLTRSNIHDLAMEPHNKEEVTTTDNEAILYAVDLPSIEAREMSFCPNSGAFPIFNKSFVLLTRDDQFGTLSKQSVQLARTVLLYNLGLATQREGLRRCDSSALLDSTRIYKAAFDTFGSTEDCLSGCSDVDSALHLLLLALINNILQLHAALSNLDEVRLWRRRLTDAVNMVSELMEEDEDSSFEDEDFDFFLLGIMSAPREDTNFAPAA